MQKHDKVAAQISLIKLPTNTTFEFELDQSSDWVKEMLMELNENATEKTPEAYLEDTAILITGELTKKDTPDMQEFVLTKGIIEVDYVTECIRTLQPMTVQLDVPFKVAFIDEALAQNEMFLDQEETYVDGETYELYFYNKRTVDFQEMLHEQIFLNYNQYPVLDADCKLIGTESQEP